VGKKSRKLDTGNYETPKKRKRLSADHQVSSVEKKVGRVGGISVTVSVIGYSKIFGFTYCVSFPLEL